MKRKSGRYGRTAKRIPGPGYIAENKSFHQALIRATDNERLLALTTQMQLPLIMFQLNGMLTDANIAASVIEHRAIATAMLDGDAEAAAAQARAHLERARDVARDMPTKVFTAQRLAGRPRINARARFLQNIAGALLVQRLDNIGAVLEHGALVDRSLVRHLASVDVRRLGEQRRLHDAVGTAGRRFGKRRQQFRETPAHDIACRSNRKRPSALSINLRQALTIGEDQHGDVIAIEAGERPRPAQRKARND